MIKEYNTNSAEETEKIANNLAQSLKPGSVIALHGELGTGKTVIAKEIARALDIKEDITSPTFNLLEEYHDGKLPLYHFDLYRIEHDDEFDLLCFEEYWEGDGVSIIEWAERAGDRLPETMIKISLDYVDEDKRRIVIEYPGN